MRLRLIATALSAASLSAAHSCLAHPGDLNRCVAPDGHSIFTDKPCDEVGATVRPEVPKDAGASAPPTKVHVSDCAHTAEALRDGVQDALEAGDVNKVAAFYHWPGTSVGEAESILNRLQAIVAHPFVSVDLLRPHGLPDTEGNRTGASAPPIDASAIDIVQTRSPTDPTPMRTELALTRYMGCWWVRF